MKTTAIILSAGKGTRLSAGRPKQYLEVGGKPLLSYSLAAFEESRIDEMIIVCGAGDEEFVRTEISEKYGYSKVCSIVPGGAERYDSVLCGLHAAAGADYVLIHDGARPFISLEVINKTIDEVIEHDAVVCGMPVKDTIKIAAEDGFIDSTTKRSLTWLVQTPQAFKYSLILHAYETVLASTAAGEITDDTYVFKLAYPDAKIKLLEGGYENIKITTPEDLEFARWKLS